MQPVDLATTRDSAAVRDAPQQQGTPIPENDVWIAALALQHAQPVVSRDAHFDNVRGVERRGW